MSSNLFLSANSLMPRGFLGWPELAIALLKKHHGNIYLTQNSPPRKKIEEFLEGQGYGEFKNKIFEEIDPVSPDIILLALEPLMHDAIPSISGKVFGSICGPFNQGWRNQIRICREMKVAGIISDILPDEFPSELGWEKLEYFCRNALFLPPSIKQEARKFQKNTSTLILHDDDHLVNNAKYISHLKNFDEFKFICHRESIDYGIIVKSLENHEAILNLLNYPQFDFFCRINSGNHKILNQNISIQGPLRDFLCDFVQQTSLPSEKANESIRSQFIQMLGKDFVPSPTLSPEIVNIFSVENLLPALERKLGISCSMAPCNKLQAVITASSWEQLHEAQVKLNRFPQVISTKRHVSQTRPMLHPAGKSSLLSILHANPNSSERVFLNPAFARQLIELPNGAYKTNLFIALANINSEKWFNSCEKALPAQYSLSFGELIFHACLVAKKQKIVNELLKFAERLFLSIANGGSKFSLYGQLWKAKLSALKPDFQLNRGDFMLSKDNFSTLARIAYEHTQQELLLPSYRANAQRFLSQFDKVFSEFYGEFGRYNQSVVAFPCAMGKTEKTFDLMQKLLNQGKTSHLYFCEYIILSYFYSNDKTTVSKAMKKFAGTFSDFKALNETSNLYKSIIHFLQGDTISALENFEAMIEEKKNTTLLSSPMKIFPLYMIYIAKSLQSSQIEQSACRIGNDLFFDFLNPQDFGDAPVLHNSLEKDRFKKIISNFICDQ